MIAIACHECGAAMALVLETRDADSAFDIYRCPADDCARKVAVIYEPRAGLTEDRRTHIEREIARHGAFFPSDVRPRGLRP